MGLKWEKKPSSTMPEFSKKMIKLYAYFCVLWISASYVLSAFDKQVNDGVTIAVITSLAVVLLGYFQKSFRENISKNRPKRESGKDSKTEGF